jgi:hypothetical protein
LIAAHRFFCAIAIQRRAPAETSRFLVGASGVAAALAAPRDALRAKVDARHTKLVFRAATDTKLAAGRFPRAAAKFWGFRPTKHPLPGDDRRAAVKAPIQALNGNRL